MAVPVEEAIAALSTFSLEDDQPELQGPGVWVSTERGATESPIGMHFLELCMDIEHLDLVRYDFGVEKNACY
ncbi:Protein PIR [Cucurbita argyrosperma subsp. argyrosperma]|nr:Protein PIR [Cucurbita argyrosperma subsp. argyrosperma]